VSVVAAQTLQFAATVTFSTNTGVSWQVNGLEEGIRRLHNRFKWFIYRTKRGAHAKHRYSHSGCEG